MSGDDAPLLFWNGGTIGPGVGWLGPSMDQGTLVPRSTGSLWEVLTPVAYIDPLDQSRARSVITHDDGLRVTITTQVVGYGVDLLFEIQNTTVGTTFTDVRFADYFNFHPNGSANSTEKRRGTTYYMGALGLLSLGNESLSTFVSNGWMYGQRIDDRHGMGNSSFAGGTQPNCGASNCLWQQVQSNTWNGLSGPVGPSDSAGALQWDLGTLAPGGTTSFLIHKELLLDGELPEPSTWVLIAAGLGLLCVGRYRRSSRSTN